MRSERKRNHQGREQVLEVLERILAQIMEDLSIYIYIAIQKKEELIEVLGGNSWTAVAKAGLNGWRDHC